MRVAAFFMHLNDAFRSIRNRQRAIAAHDTGIKFSDPADERKNNDRKERKYGYRERAFAVNAKGGQKIGKATLPEPDARNGDRYQDEHDRDRIEKIHREVINGDK